MNLHELFPFPEERKDRKRVGRGKGTGWGKTCGKGHKGQNSRAGGGTPPWFEGGQMPLYRRLPKRGFKNKFRTDYSPVNLERLASVFEGKEVVGLQDIYNQGLCPKGALVKILGNGELTGKMSVEAHAFSKSAAEKIAQSGGEAKTVEDIRLQNPFADKQAELKQAAKDGESQ